MARSYLTNAVDVLLTQPVTSGEGSIIVDDAAPLPTTPFYLVIDPLDDALREYCLCTDVTGTTLTVTRNLDGSQSQTHGAGDTVRISYVAQILDDLWDAVSAATGLPPGGVLGDSLRKASSTEGDGVWRDNVFFGTVAPSSPMLGDLWHNPADVTSTFDGADWVPLLVGPQIVSHTDLINVESDQHHARYADSEAVTAMGSKTTLNPLNHDRYADVEAIAAVDNGTYLKLSGGTMVGIINYVGPGGSSTFLQGFNQSGGGLYQLGFWSSGTMARIKVGGSTPAITSFAIQQDDDTSWMSLTVSAMELRQDMNMYSTAQKSIRMRNGASGSGHAFTQKVNGRLSIYDYSVAGDSLEIIPSVGVQMFSQNQDSSVIRNVTIATVAPTGGINGDVWIVV